MLSFRRAFIRTGLVLLGCFPTLAPSSGNTLELRERVIIASQIYSAVRVYFAHTTMVPLLEIDAAYRRYVEEMVRDSDRRQFDLATLRFVAALQNGHTHFRDSWLAANYGQPLRFWLEPVEGRWVVASTSDERLRKGDIVRGIDGVDVDQFVQRQAEYLGASNERIARSWVFYSPDLFPERFSLALEDGRTVIVDRGARAAPPGSRKLARAAPAVFSEGRWINEGAVAYLKIPSFGDPGYERTAMELVKRYQAAHCLIVDVRGNGGGSTPWALIRALMDRTWHTWREETPQRTALYEAQGGPASVLELPSDEATADSGAYSGRIILLVDRYTGSAAEDFVMPFKTTGRGTVVGETTQGSSGQPYRLDLGHGMSLMVGSVRYRFPDGSPFEGVGITPDVPVQPHIADVRDSRDPVLQKAVELAATHGR